MSNAVDVIEARKAAIGDGTEVRRLLPQRTLRTIGAWCFLDHYGPDAVVLDPTCGAGTILAEQMALSRGRHLDVTIIGGDVEWGAVASAGLNSGRSLIP